MQFLAFLLSRITNMRISGEVHDDCTKSSLNRGQINLSNMVMMTLISTPKNHTNSQHLNRRSRRLGQGSSGPALSHWVHHAGNITLSFTMPAFCKGKPRAAELRGRGLSYIRCNFKNLIYRQIFKRSQLTRTAIWKPHFKGGDPRHADEGFWGKGAELTLHETGIPS